MGKSSTTKNGTNKAIRSKQKQKQTATTATATTSTFSRSHSKQKPNEPTTLHKGTKLMVPTKMITYTMAPPNWPSKMPYLPTALTTTVATSTPLTTSQQQVINPPTMTPEIERLTPTVNHPVTYSPTSNPRVEIRPITDPTHPAFPQNGLFAAQNLAPGTHILDYTGHLHVCPQPHTCAESDYDLAFLDRDASLAIDSASMGNEARFVNDHHGIRPQGPNAMFEEYFVKVRQNTAGSNNNNNNDKNKNKTNEIWQGRMGIWVCPAPASSSSSSRPRQNQNQHQNQNHSAKNKRSSHSSSSTTTTTSTSTVSKLTPGIAKGQEICVSYGKGWWRARRNLMGQRDDDYPKYELGYGDGDGEQVDCDNDDKVSPEDKD